jgi:hypothetical protein
MAREAGKQTQDKGVDVFCVNGFEPSAYNTEGVLVC